MITIEATVSWNELHASVLEGYLHVSRSVVSKAKKTLVHCCQVDGNFWLVGLLVIALNEVLNTEFFGAFQSGGEFSCGNEGLGRNYVSENRRATHA
jgi:hypothetical protein